MAADAAAELDGDVDVLDDVAHGAGVGGHAFDRAIQIDDVQPFETMLGPGFGLGDGVAVVNRVLVHVALIEADAFAVFEVDGWKNDHRGMYREVFEGIQDFSLFL